MLEDMGIEGGKLTENKRPGGSNYTLEINGETKTFKDIKELQANFMSVLAENYIKTRQIPDEIKNLDNDALVSEFTQLIQKQDALTESENARLVDLYQELQNRGLGVNDGVNDKVKNNPTPKSKISTLPQGEGMARIAFCSPLLRKGAGLRRNKCRTPHFLATLFLSFILI